MCMISEIFYPNSVTFETVCQNESLQYTRYFLQPTACSYCSMEKIFNQNNDKMIFMIILFLLTNENESILGFPQLHIWWNIFQLFWKKKKILYAIDVPQGYLGVRSNELKEWKSKLTQNKWWICAEATIS